MSAKRRQEAIARFSVPIVEEQLDPETATSGRQRRRAAASVIEEGVVDLDGDDSDFVMSDKDDNFNDDSDDDVEEPISKRSKGKGKQKARESSPLLQSEENPRVMLLSLKAVCTLSIDNYSI